MKKKLFIALISLTILLTVSSGAVYAVEKTNQIYFADPIVESAVREGLKGKSDGPIYRDECDLITVLMVRANPHPWDKKPRIDLSGLEHLTRLNELDIYNVNVTDFSALSGLTDLESISFSSCEITDLSSLATLPNLKGLSLQRCNVEDPPSLKLSSLTGLQQLYITDTYIKDISQCSFPAGLWHLSMQNDGIREIPPLSNLTNLPSLSLRDNQIIDITPLSELTRLCCLDLTGNKIRDIAPLAKLDWVGVLDLAGNHISDVSPIAGLSHLQRVDVKDNDISDLSPLLETKVPRLKSATQKGNGPLIHYTFELNIKENPLSDASIGSYIPQLKEIGILFD